MTWLLLPLLTGCIAAWISLGSLHEYQHADSLLPVLVSTQRWTPFYWDQDRFGMLVPLLAMPVRDPLANLLVQGWLMTTSALLVPFLVARFLWGRAGGWLAAGALANLLLLLVASRAVQFDWLVNQPYALAITLGFGSLLVLEGAQRRAARAAAMSLMLLAHWVYVGVFIVVGSAIVLRRRSTARAVTITTLGVAGGALLARLAPPPHTTTALVRMSDWPHGWLQLLQTGSSAIAYPVLLFLVLTGAAVAAIVLWMDTRAREPLVAAAIAGGVAVLNWLAAGTFEWVQLNLYSPRYMFPSLTMLGVAAAIMLAAPSCRFPRAATVVACAALASLSAVLYGAPSLERLERSIDQRFGRMTPEVVSARATVIAGEYWTVWPAVFHANLTLYRLTGHGGVFGLTYRSSATTSLWRAQARQILVVAAPDDRAASVFAARVDLLLTFLEHKPSADLFIATPQS